MRRNIWPIFSQLNLLEGEIVEVLSEDESVDRILANI